MCSYLSRENSKQACVISSVLSSVTYPKNIDYFIQLRYQSDAALLLKKMYGILLSASRMGELLQLSIRAKANGPPPPPEAPSPLMNGEEEQRHISSSSSSAADALKGPFLPRSVSASPLSLVAAVMQISAKMQLSSEGGDSDLS